MIVVCLSDCPPRLRGDITQWLMEVNTGVYVGNLSARVRDELWQRICDNVGSGRATMVFSAPGEQKMSFYVHNTPWQAVDFDGITLMRRPLPGQLSEDLPRHFSNAAHRQMQRHSCAQKVPGYCAIDLETTGLSPDKDAVLEIGAVCVRDGRVEREFHTLVLSDVPIPPAVEELTGITEDLRRTEGISLENAVAQLLAFIGNDRLVAHNAAFENGFLRSACKQCGLPMLHNQFADTMILAKRTLKKQRSFKLRALAEHYELPVNEKHRALEDCRLTAQLYEKLNGRGLQML